MSPYFELIKPRVTFAALATTLLGFWIAGGTPAKFPVLFSAVIGAFLVGSGANALNQFLERDVDVKMKRTQKRPLPSGRLKPNGVLLFGLLAAVLGVACLYRFVHGLAGFLGFVTLLSYAVIYTPLKRTTPLNTFVGAFPGAMPSLIGWSAATNHLNFKSGILFLILYLWQLPHFFAIAWIHREDYEKSGLKMMTVGDVSGRSAAKQIIFYTFLLQITSLVPSFIGMAGPVYGLLALVSGLGMIRFSVFLSETNLAAARRFMNLSIGYLFLLMIAMGLDRGAAVPNAEPPPLVYGKLQSFHLTDQHNNPVTLESLRGKTWVMDFMFTRCPNQCPMMSFKMAALQNVLPKAVQFASVSVDPEHDTPDILSRYAKRFKAQEGRWFFLTGSKEEVARLLKAAHLGDSGEPSMHSLRFILIDKRGAVRGYYNSEEEAPIENLKKDIQKL